MRPKARKRFGTCERVTSTYKSVTICGEHAPKALGGLWFCLDHFQEVLTALRDQLPTDLRLRAWMMAALELDVSPKPDPAAQQDTQPRQEWIAHLEQKAQAERESESVVYFVERDGFVKIGITKNVEKRVKEIGRGSSMPEGLTVGPVRLLATFTGGRDEEKALHERFRRHHVGREWFLYDDEIRNYVVGL